MVRTSTLPRALAAALAIAAFSAQAAGAQPGDLRPSDTQAAAHASRSQQDLRSPDAADASTLRGPLQDLRSPDAADVSTLREPFQDLRSPDARGVPVSTAPPVTPQKPREVRTPSGADDGSPWAAIGIGIGGIGALLIGTVAVTSRTRRRARVAA